MTKRKPTKPPLEAILATMTDVMKAQEVKPEQLKAKQQRLLEALRQKTGAPGRDRRQPEGK